MKEPLFYNNSLSLMRQRVDNWSQIYSKEDYEENKSSIQGINDMAVQLKAIGGVSQQDRMIRDKKKSLDRALLYSYQSAFVKKLNEENLVRALINPNKLTQDYDNKIISIGFEKDFKCGDIFEWVGTNTYWLIYLQELTELAYFRADIRKCQYQISWKDGNDKKSTYAAVRGPIETKIDYSQKHNIGIDSPNYSLHILLPKNEDTLKYFKRYTKFYLNSLVGDEAVCWRVEAVDSISTSGIIEINAVEYYINETEDDIEQGIVGGLIEPVENPNSPEEELMIIGETFIKPKKTYEYKFNGDLEGKWQFNKDNLPITYEIIEDKTIKIKWISTYSGQFELSYGDYTKTIVIESLF